MAHKVLSARLVAAPSRAVQAAIAPGDLVDVSVDQIRLARAPQRAVSEALGAGL